MIRFDIDLTIEEDARADGSAPFSATVRASGAEVVVTISDASRLPRSGRAALAQLVPLADGLASRGVSVRVEGPEGLIVAFGDVKASAVQRLVSRSRHVALGGVRALARVGRDAPTAGIALPPATLLPFAPTMGRSVRRHVTTTHYGSGSGRPRLIFAAGVGGWDGGPPREFDLLPGVTRIGSGADVDLRLEGLAPLHAEIRHRESDDEYVLHPFAATGGGSAEAPSQLEQQERLLRTGARIELGGWRLAYVREEFADHGRPFGGRQGGELSRQRPQPPRPDATR